MQSVTVNSGSDAATSLEQALSICTFGGNHVETLVNGVEIFPAMLEAIEHSQSEICFETFIYWSGDIAHRFADALIAAARRGVSVSVLLDWWGCLKMDESMLEAMRQAGAQVHYFNPLRPWQIRRMNYRTHRKILVVDRRLAFTGGVGIADPWQGDARSVDEWHDLHYRVSGPVVSCFRDAFESLWCEAARHPQPVYHSHSPAAEPNEQPMHVQVLMSSPRQGSEHVYRAFRHALTSARTSILLMTAYFVPDRETIDVMLDAVARGIEFHVMVPGEHNDMQVARFASRARWGVLLQGGIHIHVYDKTMLHAKVMIVDDEWLIVGSANFDNRSFALNDEITMHVFDRQLAQQHRRIFEQDLQHCHTQTYREWKKRGLSFRLREVFTDLFSEHL